MTKPRAAPEGSAAGPALEVVHPDRTAADRSPAPPSEPPVVSPTLDQVFHAFVGRFSAGLSPTALTLAWHDWAMHLAGAPARQMALGAAAVAGAARIGGLPVTCARKEGDCRDLTADQRFRDPAWETYPYNAIARSFLVTQQWWEKATDPLPGVDRRHAQMVRFGARQILDMMAPSNFALTNPAVLERSREEFGLNYLRGLQNWRQDMTRLARGAPGDQGRFRVGETLAVTPGDVVYRNELIELIRYRPTTERLRGEPVLIVPAWIMKYYILDLTPEASLVRHLVAEGFEVYITSWRNPERGQAGLGMEDYLKLGVLAALDALGRALPGRQVHAAGYCLGGTLLAITAATLAREGRDALKTLTLLAAQVDFSDAGEVTLFINESQVAFLEDMMALEGYLRAEQMSGAFKVLRSNDLIWSRVVRHYLLGERTEPNALMAWNADSTRMPARMHSDYLRRLFLENRLALGEYEVEGRPVSLADIEVPVFCVGTERDHVAPWRSVWKLTGLTDAPVTFALTNGGHNAGIVSEPGHAGRHYRLGAVGRRTVEPNDWFADHDERAGSWWPAWSGWLAERSGPPRPAEAAPEVSLGPAPGSYVHG